MKDSKAIYTDLCAEQKDIPVFMRSTWMDLTCPDGWDVALGKDDKGDVQAAVVYEISHKMGFRRLTTPMNTPSSGIWWKSMPSSETQRDALVSSLVSQIPAAAMVFLKLDLPVESCLPFHWRSYELLSRLTYRLNLEGEPGTYRGRYSRSLKSRLRRDHGHELRPLNYKQFWEGWSSTPLSASLPAWSADRGMELNQWLERQGCHVHIQGAYREGELVSGIYVLGDNRVAYYLMSFTLDKARKSELNYHLLDQSIERMQSLGHEIFDFEGSMLPGVFEFVRRFGGSPYPITAVRRYSSRIYNLMHLLGTWKAY